MTSLMMIQRWGQRDRICPPPQFNTKHKPTAILHSPPPGHIPLELVILSIAHEASWSRWPSGLGPRALGAHGPNHRRITCNDSATCSPFMPLYHAHIPTDCACSRKSRRHSETNSRRTSRYPCTYPVWVRTPRQVRATRAGSC